MGRIPDETIETIRDRIDLVGLVGRTVSLRKSGRNYKGLCPFHEEKTPSFYVNPERRIFHCFGCSASGDVFEFLMRHENLTFREAAESTARECGVEIPASAGGEPGQNAQLAAANQLAQEFYRSTLEGPAGAAARAYLDQRGIDAAAREHFGIGFAPDRWEALAQALAKATIAAPVGEKAGLLAARRSGGYYDRLRDRVTFPIRDVRGRVVGFGGRVIDSAKEPKYLNTPESPLFRKREIFYGFPDALEPMRRTERAVVVEGYFDRIALQQAGVEESVATCGTALSAEHVRQLRRRTGQVVLLFDADAAGERAGEAALELLLAEGLRVFFVALPPGDDPDTLLRREGADALRARVEQAESALDVVMRRAAARGIATPFEKADAVRAVLPLLARIPDRFERREFSRRLATIACVDVRDVELAVGEARGERPEASASSRPVARAGAPEIRFARRLAMLLLVRPEFVHRFRPGEPADLVADPGYDALLGALAEACRQGGPVDVTALGSRLPEEQRAILHELACDERYAVDPSAEEPPDVDRIWNDTLVRLRLKQNVEEQRALNSRYADGSADDARAYFEQKQRHLERRRVAQGLDPHPPDTTGGVEVLR